MRIALFSDIHANLPALEAFFNDVESRDTDAIYCLGDLVGYNIWPNEVIDQIRKRGIPAIAGNYDFGIGRSSDDCGCAYKTDDEKENGKVSIAYTNEIIKDGQRAYLRALPAHIRLDFQGHDRPLSVLLVHGSPRRVNEYLFEDRDENSMLRIMEQAGTDVMLFGHTHKPYHRILHCPQEDGTVQFRHAVNIGSVGKPKDGDPRGGYVILHMNADASISVKESITVEFIRFEYNIEKAAKAIEDSILPDAYAESLRRGK
ncbi:metallophosphoesterase family protein [Dyadobacter aurulentus]|uniref:metallophosphoesterase family protein n=1 Tax=Dyadobacter sp. UC 10 TaxID=2605428 RepID=UPI0011F26A4F|nr:metallophosphoesterase family protein [Dyadobacter sp. UC 10]KAA0988825.1 metallophosphoesterase family protein [Dyadobacter sp. UC 10]